MLEQKYIKKITIISNTVGLEKVKFDGVIIDLIEYPVNMSHFKAGWYIYKKSFNSDFIIIICDINSLLIQCVFRLIPVSNKCRLISIDTVMQIPISIKERIKAFIKSLLFRKIDLFIEYFKDINGYERYYGMDKNKFRYTPFKINRYEEILTKIDNNAIGDEGYIFCGGNTMRDYDTLFEVAKMVDYQFLVVTMNNDFIIRQGSYIDENKLPDNIKVIRHDGSSSFLDYIAMSRLVALPIKENTISASGIGVYLACMALRKCVIISSGPSVNDIVSNEAIIVPPGDPYKLKDAIVKAYENNKFRERYAQCGQKYALALKGEKRLYYSIMEIIFKEYEIC